MEPDLFALVLHLRPAPGGPPPDPRGHGAQALFLDLVRQVDPDLAARLHADAASKPYTVAVLPWQGYEEQGNRRTGEQGNRRTGEQGNDHPSPITHHPSPITHRPSPNPHLPPIELRVTLAQAELFGPFTRALLQQTARPAMHLGRVALALEDVLGTPGSHPWAGYSSFAELAARAAPAQQVTLHFVTAAAFGQGTRADGRPRLGLLPTPETVFKSLVIRWNEWSPPDLAIDPALVEAAARETLVSRYRLETAQISLGKGPQKGFVGTCTYELPPDQEPSRLLSQLADAAFYLGIGMKTARGMGLCRRGP